MTKLDKLRKEWLKRPDVKAAYDGMAEEFSITKARILARTEADMTQKQIPEKR